MVGVQSGKGHMMIGSVVFAQYINVTDIQTATSPQQMPTYAWRQMAKTKPDTGNLCQAHTYVAATLALPDASRNPGIMEIRTKSDSTSLSA